MKILIASSIDSDAIEQLKQHHQVILAFNKPNEPLETLIPDCEVLVFRSGVKISAQLMERSPNLKLLIRAGSGLDNLDLDYVQRNGLVLIRIPQPGAKAVAEMTFALMLALSRRLFEADQSMRQGRWKKYELSGYLLQGKTLGIIGIGEIGGRVAEMGMAWGMRAISHDGFLSPERVRLLSEKGVELLDFDQVVSQSDYLSLHVPLNESTRYMINATVLENMKPGSYLINLARGGIVDEQALYKALTSGGRLRGAALDVHEREGEGKLSPLASLNNVILTPHIGAMAVDAQREIGQRVVEIVKSYTASPNQVKVPRNGGVVIESDSQTVRI